MARSIPALVKPELLVWARKSAGFTLARSADVSNIEEMTLQEWERGHEVPSVSQLRTLAEVYKRPIAVFFLSEPPVGFSAQREFRRLAGIAPGKESPELLSALRWALFRREAAEELHRLRGDESLRFGAKLHPDLEPEEAGRKIRKVLGVTWEEQLNWPVSNAHRALNHWRAAIEALGVLVFQTSEVPLDEMRGTCIPDLPYPVILLNNKDAPHGRIFSLIHEFAHILLNSGGHKTTRMVGEHLPEEQPLEVAANAFAAATLMPADSFSRLAANDRGAIAGDDHALKAMAAKVKVSPEALLRRLVTLGFATERTYRRKRDEWGTEVWYVGGSKGEGGPTMDIKTISKDGIEYTRLVLDSYDRRLINTSTASDYLGVKPVHFPDIRRELVRRPASSE